MKSIKKAILLDETHRETAASKEPSAASSARRDRGLARCHVQNPRCRARVPAFPVHTRRLAGVLCAALCALLFGCMAADLDTPCSRNLECASGLCEQGLCTQACSLHADCPGFVSQTVCSKPPGSASASERTGRCHYRLPVLALNYGAPSEQDAWTTTHDEGLGDAASALPFVTLAQEDAGDATGRLPWTRKNNLKDTPADANHDVLRDEVGRWVHAQRLGLQGRPLVVITNSVNQSERLATIANTYAQDEDLEHKQVIFINMAGFRVNDVNLGTAFAHMERAWYTAGQVAAHKLLKDDVGLIRNQNAPLRAGFIGSIPTAEVIRHMNAFALGVQDRTREFNQGLDESQKKRMEVVVRWLGAWSGDDDAYKQAGGCPTSQNGSNDIQNAEECIADELIQVGCTVLAHHLDNQRVVEAVARWRKTSERRIYSLGNNHRNACYKGLKNEELQLGCLGSTHWNWGPVYKKIFERIQRKQWQPELTILEDWNAAEQDRTVGFSVSQTSNREEDKALAQVVAKAFLSIAPSKEFPYGRMFLSLCDRKQKEDDPSSIDEVCPVLDAECLTTEASRDWLSMCRMQPDLKTTQIVTKTTQGQSIKCLGIEQAVVPVVNTNSQSRYPFFQMPTVEARSAFCASIQDRLPQLCRPHENMRDPPVEPR